MAEFFVKYVPNSARIAVSSYLLHRFHEHIDALNVSADALYTALVQDAEVQPGNWDLQGRQADAWKALGS